MERQKYDSEIYGNARLTARAVRFYRTGGPVVPDRVQITLMFLALRLLRT